MSGGLFIALALALLTAPAAGVAAPVAALSPASRAAIVERLERRLDRIAQRPGGVRVGIAALHLESGAALAVNGDEAFPMASAFKLAVAATYLHGVEQGRFTLDQMIAVDDRMRVQSGGISTALPYPGVSLSAANMLDLMITRSDNTAADIMTQLVGGPAAVTAWLRSVGIDGQRVDRDVAGLILDYKKQPVDPGSTVAETLARFLSLRDDNPDEPSSPLNPDFIANPRDSSTPRAMLTLMAKLYQGKLLDPAHTRFLIDTMEHTITGAHRIKAMLPPRTVFAHKTGTLVGICVDVGVLTLPGGGHVALAVFVKGSPEGDAAEHIIAEVGRTLYDGFAPLD